MSGCDPEDAGLRGKPRDDRRGGACDADRGAERFRSADALAGIIAFAAELPDDIEVHARHVTSVQADCLESLTAAARERAQHGQSRVVLVSASAVLREALRGLGSIGTPPMSLAEQGTSGRQPVTGLDQEEQ
jgi:hypothetical protein